MLDCARMVGGGRSSICSYKVVTSVKQKKEIILLLFQ